MFAAHRAGLTETLTALFYTQKVPTGHERRAAAVFRLPKLIIVSFFLSLYRSALAGGCDTSGGEVMKKHRSSAASCTLKVCIRFTEPDDQSDLTTVSDELGLNTAARR